MPPATQLRQKVPSVTLKYTNKTSVAQHTRSISERTKNSEWGNKTWIICTDKYAPLDGVSDLDQQGWNSATLGADASLFNHPLFRKVTGGCFYHGELCKTKQASGVSGRGLGCKSATNAQQLLTAFSQLTLKSYSDSGRAEQPYSAPVLLFESYLFILLTKASFPPSQHCRTNTGSRFPCMHHEDTAQLLLPVAFSEEWQTQTNKYQLVEKSSPDVSSEA